MSAVKACALATENNEYSRQLTSNQSVDSETLYWIDSVPINEQTYLHDHRVAGKAIYPAAGFSMAGVVVHQALRGSRNNQKTITLKDLKFRRTLSLSDVDPTVLQLSYRPRQDEFAVHSRRRDDSGPLTLHASGRLARTDSASSVSSVELKDMFARCCESVNVANFYQRLDQSGLHYGPFFQRIKLARVSRHTNEAVTRLAIHPELAMIQDLRAQSVTLLDSAFQSLAATLDMDNFELYVPLRIQSLIVHGDLCSDLWCYARLVNVTSRAVIGDITIFDLNGRALIEIRGLHCLRTSWKRATGFNTAANNQQRNTSRKNIFQ